MTAQISIPLLVMVVFIVYIVSSRFKKFNLYLPRDLDDYLSSHSLKYKYYSMVSEILKYWNAIVLVLFIIIVLLSMILSLIVFIAFVINIIKANIPTIPEFLFIDSLIKYTLIALVSTVFSFLSLSVPGIAIFAITFPLNKSSGLIDTSDIPILFIAKAIDDVNSFNFSLPCSDLQQNRKKISNLVHDALEFITFDDKFFAIPLGMRYYQFFISGLKNKDAKRDILQRINGLTEELGEIIIKSNCMNSVSDQEDISNRLEKYLKIIKDGNLSEIENKVEYEKYNVIWGTIKKRGTDPLFYLIKIILRLEKI
ncbi:MAG: hypothetical protein KAH86_06070 [Methanosarcinales archaeon]|nr:hypothetical protein [Methanosarcinales archaeon]